VRRAAAACLALAAALAGEAPVAGDAAPGPKGTVVLLHGLARSSGSMRPLEHALQTHGFLVENVDYPSTEKSIDELVRDLELRLAACCLAREGPLHFVTHSLGGILLRAYLLDHRPERLGRVVMLAPPNQGSEWVDRLRAYAAFEAALGPAATELGTDPESAPSRLNALGPVDYPLGVIAGTGSVNPLAALVIPGGSDGTVSVESTQVAGMVDFLEMDASHTFIMQDPAVMAEVLHFLEQGRFERAGLSPPAGGG
jgi:pimeloyl-ACP methyl ester carboxylesterase